MGVSVVAIRLCAYDNSWNTITKRESTMNNFVIHTDSGCDISQELLNQWDVSCTDMTFVFDGESTQYACRDMTVKAFYDRMRQGAVAKTAAVNIDTFEKAFEPILLEGKDILYLGFSSGLSTTCNSAQIAAQQLMQDYPNRKIITMDTLAASAGQGILVYVLGAICPDPIHQCGTG